MGASGRGPISAISPRATFHNCGSSSRWYSTGAGDHWRDAFVIGALREARARGQAVGPDEPHRAQLPHAEQRPSRPTCGTRMSGGPPSSRWYQDGEHGHERRGQHPEHHRHQSVEQQTELEPARRPRWNAQQGASTHQRRDRSCPGLCKGHRDLRATRPERDCTGRAATSRPGPWPDRRHGTRPQRPSEPGLRKASTKAIPQ